MADRAWPTELRRLDQGRALRIAFDDGASFELTAEYLRVQSPSAEVRGHGPGQHQVQSGKSQVRITGVEPVGNYAARLIFDDGHSTGIYTWPYLRELGMERDRRWAAYLQELAGKGLSR